MAGTINLPVIFLAFANPPFGAQGHLRNLGEEARRLEKTLKQAEKKHLCELVVKAYAGLDEILAVFREFRNRVAIFHYAGHAKNFELLLEDAVDGTVGIDSRGLATVLGQQTGLQLVFLNGCSTQPQVDVLQAANIPAIIATSQAIRDDVATRLASEFYVSLAGGATIQSAFSEAQGAVKAMIGSSNVRDAYFKDAETVADRWPWSLSLKPGAELVGHWNLPDAADDPLFGLPSLPSSTDLPEKPFRNILWFRYEDAPIFFGRGYDIRALFQSVTAPDGHPIVLYYGQSGVGKSSVLAAGLLPRLKQVQCVAYARREHAFGLTKTLAATLHLPETSGDPGQIHDAWLAAEANADQPLTLILDQVEEVYTRPNPHEKPAEEMARFLDLLVVLFGNQAKRPKGRLILSFRKEWLAELTGLLTGRSLPKTDLFLKRMDKRSIVEAVTGPATSARLQRHYGLTVEPTLANEIADDLLADPVSAVAPTLQILLDKMWQRAKECDYNNPLFDRTLYHELRRQGLLLGDFLDAQLATLAKRHPEISKSGLVLDLLAFHTTPLATAEVRTISELQRTYAHQVEVLEALLGECIDLFLLVHPAENQPDAESATRMAHDTLAPLVRARFDESDALGQRARRILESRSLGRKDNGNDASETTPAPLGDADLDVVENGKSGMPRLDFSGTKPCRCKPCRPLTPPGRRGTTATKGAQSNADGSLSCANCLPVGDCRCMVPLPAAPGSTRGKFTEGSISSER